MTKKIEARNHVVFISGVIPYGFYVGVVQAYSHNVIDAARMTLKEARELLQRCYEGMPELTCTILEIKGRTQH